MHLELYEIKFWGSIDWARLDDAGDCWIWRGRLWKGYGYTTAPSVGTLLAHRVAYELLVGPIPEDLTLDHLCRNRACVNPGHLEPVTSAENTRRMAPYRRHNYDPRPKGHLASSTESARRAQRYLAELT